MEKITDFDARNLPLIISQYTNSEKLKGIISGANTAANDIELALFEIQDKLYLAVATGVQLDIIGAVFNVARDGRIDPLYRQAIQERAVLSYSGEPESIIEILQSVYGASYVYYRPGYPGKYYLLTDIDISSETLNPVNPAGVSGLLEKFLIDGAGNYILDATGKNITAVIELEVCFILDALGNSIVSGADLALYTICKKEA